MYSITVQPMKKSLQMLSKILDKAVAYAETKADQRRTGAVHMEAMLNDRIVFDQFTLTKQIQISCDNAKGGACRLAEIEIPTFEDNEKTVAELKARIEKTIAILDSIKPEQIIGKENIKVTLPYFKEKYFTGFEYATQYLLPNFYFHVTTAYDIIRKNGVNIGKADFINGLPLKSL